MTMYYLDTESTGINPKEDKLITIQYQRLDKRGRPDGELIILREWESSEEDIIKRFHKIFMEDNVWSFIPVLHNFIFDLTFIFEKFKKYNLKCPELSEYLYKKPFIDIKYSLVLMNDFEFKGSGLDNFTAKKTNGRDIPIWYQNKEYSKIEDYIKNETEAFLDFLSKLSFNLYNFRRIYGTGNN